MQFLFALLNFLVYLMATSDASPQIGPECDAPSTRALIRSAVEQQFALHGVPVPGDYFNLLNNLQHAKSPRSNAISGEFRRQLAVNIIQVCEVNEASQEDPMFMTFFMSGSGVPQPSGIVMNFGLPKAVAAIGTPP